MEYSNDLTSFVKIKISNSFSDTFRRILITIVKFVNKILKMKVPHAFAEVMEKGKDALYICMYVYIHLYIYVYNPYEREGREKI